MIGVDPHKGSHTAVAIGAAEEPLGELRVRASATQAERLVTWAAAWPERIWAVEGAAGLGPLLAQQLVGVGERVLDVPPKLAARVRLLEAGDTNKNDPNDALSVAVAALRSRARREVTAATYRLPLMSNAMPSAVRSRGAWATTTGIPALPPVVSGTRTIVPESDTETYRLSRRNASSLAPMLVFVFGASSGSCSQMAAFPPGGSRQIAPRLLSEIYRYPSWKASPFGKLSAGSVATRVTPPPAPIRNTPGGVGDASNGASATSRFPLGSKAKPVSNPPPTSRLATGCCCPLGVTFTTSPMKSSEAYRLPWPSIASDSGRWLGVNVVMTWSSAGAAWALTTGPDETATETARATAAGKAIRSRKRLMMSSPCGPHGDQYTRMAIRP